MKIARPLCVVAAAVLTGAVLITIRARAQTAVLPNTPAVKEVLAEQFVAEQALKTANSSLETAKKLMEKRITTSAQVEAVQAQVNRALAQYESIAAKLKALNSAAPAKATTTPPLEPEVEYKSETRERRYVIQKPVRQPDGSTKIELEEVIEQVPVTIPVTPVIAEREVGTTDGKVVRTTVQAAPAAAYSSTANAYLRASYPAAYGHPDLPDEESQKLFEEEKKTATEAAKLQADLRKAKFGPQRVDIRAKLREKLAEIFDLQQKRRAHEVEAIEERVGKLKETMKKRDAAKDSIVDRRLELVIGGVDELGWEETGAWPQGAANTIRGGYGIPAYPQLAPQPIGVPQIAPSTVPIVPAPPTRARPAKAKAAARPQPIPAPAAAPQPPSPADFDPSADPADPAAPAAPAPPAPAAAPALPAPPAVPAPAAAPAAPVAPVPVLPPQPSR